MAVVYPKENAPSFKTWASVALSTSTDGVTGADILDTGGLSVTAIQPSTACSSACTYTLRGAIDDSANVGTLYGSTGDVIGFGSTAIDPRGAVFARDPAILTGIRFVQLVSNTTAAAAPNATGATAKVFLSAYGQVK